MEEISPATEEGPARRRRDSWNLRHIVEDVTGRSIEDLQEPGRPTHPFLKSAPPTPATPHRGTVSTTDSEEETTFDPVARVHPPLVGEMGRSFHGSENQHHQPTLDDMTPATEPPSPGTRPHTPGPSRRPERIYLHYLLLHIDRLSDSALKYLQRSVEEEVQHRKI
ncbi:MAG: hypothetical protein L3K14_02000 [Thermoplasmata archaeon]|nr:hypothetical protein [Thermoplasmata archaeon]